MPWWIWVYLAIFGVLTIGGCFDDLSDRRPYWYAAAGVVSAAIATIGTLSLWWGLPQLGVARIWLPIVAVATVWESVAAVEDVRSPEFEGPWRVFAVISAILLIAPAYLLALAAALRPWM